MPVLFVRTEVEPWKALELRGDAYALVAGAARPVDISPSVTMAPTMPPMTKPQTEHTVPETASETSETTSDPRNDVLIVRVEHVTPHVMQHVTPHVMGESWTLLAGARTDVRVNGLVLGAGVHALVDRDEVWVRGAGTFCFSKEGLPRIEGFPRMERPLDCARCRNVIVEGTPAVRCPSCRRWFHERISADPREHRPCWTYTELCGACSEQPTALDATLRWTPEDP
ncbi:MAG: hypothetical protein AB1486_00955 [Planctomycetota bacterium]